ncbi:MAG: hypothetical protein ACO31I_19230, partial [Prochlorotrichaceae cyanobacterium]
MLPATISILGWGLGRNFEFFEIPLSIVEGLPVSGTESLTLTAKNVNRRVRHSSALSWCLKTVSGNVS